MGSVAIIGKQVKQPSEVLDYQVDFSEWFSNREDTPASHTVTADTGITLVSNALAGEVVTVVLGGGTCGESYKITVLLTTSGGIVKEADFVVKVKAV